MNETLNIKPTDLLFMIKEHVVLGLIRPDEVAGVVNNESIKQLNCGKHSAGRALKVCTSRFTNMIYWNHHHFIFNVFEIDEDEKEAWIISRTSNVEGNAAAIMHAAMVEEMIKDATQN